MNRQIPILPILLMVAIAAGAYGLYKTVEFEEQAYFESQSTEARKNPYLAASRFLEKHGFATSVAQNRGVLTNLNISDTGILLLDDINELTDVREVESLVRWIHSGGILLTSPVGAYAFEETNVANELLQQFGVNTLENIQLLENQLEKQNNENVFYLSLNDKDFPDDLALSSNDAPYFVNSFTHSDAVKTLIDSPALIHKSMGKGYFTIYSDPALFRNEQLEHVDQAYALLWLTQPAKSNTMMVVYQPAGKPGLFKLLWSKFTVSILLAGLVLAGFLRWASSRLGPVEHELPPINNNLMAHLQARGEYWYRHKHTPDVVANVQQSTQEKLVRKQGKLREKKPSGADYNNEDRADIIKQASKLLKCSTIEAEKILFAHTAGDANILHASRALQKINHQKLFKQQNPTE